MVVVAVRLVDDEERRQVERPRELGAVPDHAVLDVREPEEQDDKREQERDETVVEGRRAKAKTASKASLRSGYLLPGSVAWIFGHVCFLTSCLAQSKKSGGDISAHSSRIEPNMDSMYDHPGCGIAATPIVS